MSDAVELKSCPFCGGPARTLEYNGTTQATCAVEGIECAGTDVLAPVAYWNRRAGTAAPDLLEAAREADAVLRTMYATVISDRDAARVREAFDSLGAAITKATRNPTHD